MLDVHPPHAAAHTWADFFIHIATIVIGLFIAVGLEQSVEYLHHRHQVAEAREALKAEREENKILLANEVKNWRWESAELENNLMIFEYILRHPGVPQDKLPGVPMWSHLKDCCDHAVWDATVQSGIAGLMPPDERQKFLDHYLWLKVIDDADFSDAHMLYDAMRFQFGDPDPTHLGTENVKDEISRIQAAQVSHYWLGITLVNLDSLFPDFPHALPRNELAKYVHNPVTFPNPSIAHAMEQTEARLRAAGWKP